MIQLRTYQEEAVNAAYSYIAENDGKNPCIVLPTGAGKTVVIAKICRDAVLDWDSRVLVLAHVKELLEQSAKTLVKLAPELDGAVGIYSAGLKARDTRHPVIIAGIQSVYRRAPELGRFDVVIVDEAHLIPPDGEGMYRQFLQEALIVNPYLRVIGLTATPYRMKTGTICGDEHILTEVCHEVGVKSLIDEGYLSPMRSKNSSIQADLSDVHIRAGEFVKDELEAAMTRHGLVEAACAEVLALTKDRRSTLVFAAGVKHAKLVAKELEKSNRPVAKVFGSTPAKERDEIVDAFRRSEIAYLVNVNVLSIGFDAPNTDCIVLLRPTASPGLFYQQCGRGFRVVADIHGHDSADVRKALIKASAKPDCLVLDYGGNIVRHGPVDSIKIAKPKKSTGEGEAPVKTCPECQEVVHAAVRECSACGFQFPPPDYSHEKKATTAGIITGEVKTEVRDVMASYYSEHTKRGMPEDYRPKTLQVMHRIGFNEYVYEYICLEHDGYARMKAESWWNQYSLMPCPDYVSDAVSIAETGGLADTLSVTIRVAAGEKYPKVIGRTLSARPEPEYAGGVLDDDLPF